MDTAASAHLHASAPTTASPITEATHEATGESNMEVHLNGLPLPRISQEIWAKKYRVEGEQTPADTWRRLAFAFTAVEDEDKRPELRARFLRALENFGFFPGGRITSGLGSGRPKVTLLNCFVMGTIQDSMDSIFDVLKDGALTMQAGGGTGYDFSTIRPSGAPVNGVGSTASGPIPFMHTYNSMSGTVESAGSRRGAMLAVLRVDHPDIEAFIEAKKTPDVLTMFNLSVGITDAFMAAVEADRDFDLVFNGTTYKTVRAVDLWNRIMAATYDYAEPGVIFIDRYNTWNNLWYCEQIAACNPCGEQGLPPNGACDLGSIVLPMYVQSPFSPTADLDWEALKATVRMGVRMLDNVLDLSYFPVPAQRLEAQNKRRIGLGVTGLGNALAMLGARYGSPNAIALTERIMTVIRDAAYNASVDLAIEKGPFPLFDADKYLQGKFIQTLPADLQERIRVHGIRNSHLTSIAPTGTMSLTAGNISSGLEPTFAWSYTRKIRLTDKESQKEQVEDHAYRLWRHLFGAAPLPPAMVTANDLTPADHVAMQAVMQRYVDSSISKTVNVPVDTLFEDFKDIYLDAWRQGCKGITTYRPSGIRGAVLTETPQAANVQANDQSVAEGATNTPATTHSLEADSKSTEPLKPLERPDALSGQTYKVNWPGLAHRYYVTINDSVDPTTGALYPHEIFISSKDVTHKQWTDALCHLITGFWRQPRVPNAFVVDQLRSVYDPQGGQWIPGQGYVKSLVAAIGDVIARHIKTRINNPQVAAAILNLLDTLNAPEALEAEAAEAAESETEGAPTTPTEHGAASAGAGEICKQCGEPAVFQAGGCKSCRECGYSECE
jgi:ribonucleoside-diphosphate reductase alpha chain